KRLTALSQEERQSFVEPALDQCDVGGNPRRNSAHVERALRGCPAFPIFAQSLERIETVDALARQRSEEADRMAVKDTELDDQPAGRARAEGMPPQRFFVAADAKRLLHVAVGVVG